MRFGKPTLTTDPEPEAKPVERIPIIQVMVDVRGGLQWTWTSRGDDRVEHALALLNKLTGEPDAQGWIRDDDEDWAYRAEEIRSVTLRYMTEEKTD